MLWVTAIMTHHMFVFFLHSCLAGTDNVKHENEIDLFDAIDENVSRCPESIAFFFIIL